MSEVLQSTERENPILGVLDVETTGFLLPDVPLGHDMQPRIVQGGFLSFDLAGRIHQAVSITVRPDGWDIPDEAENVHGISYETAQNVGMDQYSVLPLLADMITSTDVVIGHNIPYDLGVVRSHLKAMENARPDDVHLRSLSSRIANVPRDCTMREGAGITNFPPSLNYGPEFIGKPKPPRLSVLYNFLTGEEMQDAHSAMGDCLGTKRVFEEILRQGYLRPDSLPLHISEHLGGCGRRGARKYDQSISLAATM